MRKNNITNSTKYSLMTVNADRKLFLPKLLIIFVLALFAINLCVQTAYRICYELSGPFTWDTHIYLTVGRGLLNGLKPYVDLFETKPPGIFFLSAFSLLVSGGLLICNILQAIVLVVTAFIPVQYSIYKVKTEKNSLLKTDISVIFLISVLFGLLLSLYCARRSGEVQVESFGAAFACVYVYFISKNSDSNITRSYLLSKDLVLSSVFLLFSYGMKEPFILICFACALIFSKDVKQLEGKFILPALYSAIIGILILFVTNTLIPFINFYLPYMMGSHINRFDSPWQRALQFNIVLDDLKLFSPYLGFLIIYIILAFVFMTFDENKNRKPGFKMFLKIFYDLLRLSSAIYLTSAAVGMGGEYFNHHFAFAVPTYMALFLYLLDYMYNGEINIKKHIILLPLIALLCINTVSTEKIDYNFDLNYLAESDRGNKEEARYIDSVLDRMQIDRYLFIGTNGPHFYSYTKHSPDGPFFFQLDPWMDTANTKFRHLFMEQVRRAKIIVFDEYQIGDLQYEVQGYIAHNFITVPWREVRDIPRDYQKYQIYFARRNK